jgi:porin
VSAYARFGLGNAAVARIGRYAGIGIVHESGLLAAREDAVGFGVACARNGRAWRDAAAEAGEATTQGECDLELTWRLELGGHVALQPDLQYVIDPGTDPAVDDALVFVLRVEAWF